MEQQTVWKCDNVGMWISKPIGPILPSRLPAERPQIPNEFPPGVPSWPTRLPPGAPKIPTELPPGVPSWPTRLPPGAPKIPTELPTIIPPIPAHDPIPSLPTYRLPCRIGNFQDKKLPYDKPKLNHAIVALKTCRQTSVRAITARPSLPAQELPRSAISPYF